VQEQHETLMQKLEAMTPSRPLLQSHLQTEAFSDIEGSLAKQDNTVEQGEAQAPKCSPGRASPADTSTSAINGSQQEAPEETACDAQAEHDQRMKMAEHKLVKVIYKQSGFLENQHRPNIFTRLVETIYFSHTVSLLILANSIFVGVEMEAGMQSALDGKSTLDDRDLGRPFCLQVSADRRPR